VSISDATVRERVSLSDSSSTTINDQVTLGSMEWKQIEFILPLITKTLLALPGGSDGAWLFPTEIVLVRIVRSW
jgi:hypothetical protein